MSSTTKEGSPGRKLRIGVDIGGTFTDMVILDETTGSLQNFKGLSTPEALSEGVVKLIEDAQILTDHIVFLAHGTTVGINALLERKGPPTGIVATEGFEDVLELRRCARTHLLDPFMEKPWMFVPRRWSVGVTERVRADGTIRKPVDLESARRAIRYLADEGVESVAICLLNAYANPVHEVTLKEMVDQEFPNLYCCISSQILREVKEYERTSTTALNAYLLPVLSRYFTQLRAGLKEHGVATDFYVMQSNGQLMSRGESEHKPVHTVESGSTAGSVGAAYIGAVLGYENVISFDMGGTTSKASVIEGGHPRVTMRFELFEEPNKPGSGWPIRLPMVEIVEISIAGGSMSWVDEGGTFHVGPRSAGASPGPVCYDLGSEQPTVTDPDAVLGRLESLLADGLTLNIDKARDAIEDRIAKPLDLSVDQAAAGIAEMADTRAADVVRQLTAARGRDPRDSVLVVFGGAGPLHAARILADLGMPEAVIPPVAGNFSAFGLLCTDLGQDAARTQVMQTAAADPSSVEQIYQELAELVITRLEAQGAPADRIVVSRTVDMRYAGQLHEVNVRMPDSTLTPREIETAEAAFHQGHLREYAYESEGETTEMVTFRVRAVWRVRRPKLQEIEAGSLDQALKKRRQVYFYELGRRVECPVYQREKLGKGCSIDGPAIVEEMSSTTLVPPSFRASVDQYGKLRLKRVIS